MLTSAVTAMVESRFKAGTSDIAVAGNAVEREREREGEVGKTQSFGRYGRHGKGRVKSVKVCACPVDHMAGRPRSRSAPGMGSRDVDELLPV